jgi:hypothetical protein
MGEVVDHSPTKDGMRLLLRGTHYKQQLRNAPHVEFASRLSVSYVSGMEEQKIHKSRHYGFRFKPRSSEPLPHVKVIEKVGRKGAVKIRFMDEPHCGLEEFVETRQLVVPWPERKAYLRDEERLQRLKRLARVHRHDSARFSAVDVILAATGHDDAWLHRDGRLSIPRESAALMAGRAGIEDDLQGLHTEAFTDRLGELHLPFEAAETLARAFAAAESESVLLYIEGRYQELRAKALLPENIFGTITSEISNRVLRSPDNGLVLRTRSAPFAGRLKGRKQDPHYDVVIGNAGNAAVFDCVVRVGFVQEDEQEPIKIGTLPPDKLRHRCLPWRWSAEHTKDRMYPITGALEFEDPAGRHWRRDMTGKLSPIRVKWWERPFV